MTNQEYSEMFDLGVILGILISNLTTFRHDSFPVALILSFLTFLTCMALKCLGIYLLKKFYGSST